MEQWKGKVAIVTGASAGIGAAIVIELVKNGVHVVALARRENKLKYILDAFKINCQVDVIYTDFTKPYDKIDHDILATKLYHLDLRFTLCSSPFYPELAESLNDIGTVYTKVCDVSNEQAVIDVFSWVDSTLGGPSILINNAAVVNISSLLNGNLKDWQDTLNLNVLGLSVCSREACKSMKKNNIDGHIIQLNSVIGHCTTSYFGFKMYNASKYAVTVLCDGLRHELQLIGSKIKVTSVSPGPVDTEMLASVGQRMGDSTNMGFKRKILKPKDIADAVITSLATPPNVLIAEITVIPTGITIQPHSQPTPQMVENILNL